MINTLRNKKRGLIRFSKLPDDGDPLAPNNLLKPGGKEKHRLNCEIFNSVFIFSALNTINLAFECYCLAFER